MPCDQIRTCQIDLDVADRDILKAALTNKLGWSFTERNNTIYARTKNGTAVTIHADHVEMQRGQEKLADQIKRAYSFEMLDVGSLKFGFAVTKDAAGEPIALSKDAFTVQEQFGGSGGFQVQQQFGA